MKAIDLEFDELLGINFIKWPEEADDGIIFSINPSQEERVSRRAKIENRMVKPVINFLKSKGFKIRMPKTDEAYRKRKKLWSEKLSEGCVEFSDLEILEYLDSLDLNLRSIQEQGVLLAVKNYITLISAICGSGKTVIMLALLQFFKNRGGVRALILSPNAVTGEYSKELKKFGRSFNLTIDDLSTASDFEVRCRLQTSKCDIVVLPFTRVHKFSEEIKEFANKNKGFEKVLLPDEGHNIKNVKSRVSKSVSRIAPFFDRVVISTATPVPLGPKDIRGYLSTVSDPLPENLYKNGIPSEDYKILEGMAFVSGEEDLEYCHVDKIKVTYKNRDELDSHLLNEVDSELNAGRKAIVFCTTNSAVSHLHNLLKNENPTVLSGSYHTKDFLNSELIPERSAEFQQKAISQFNNDPDCKILIANYRVGSTGLNLQGSGARLAFFYEITTNGADFFQSKYRIRRPYIFPEGGFRYVYGIPLDIRQRRRATKQFAKLDNQFELLNDLKVASERKYDKK